LAIQYQGSTGGDIHFLFHQRGLAVSRLLPNLLRTKDRPEMLRTGTTCAARLCLYYDASDGVASVQDL